MATLNFIRETLSKYYPKSEVEGVIKVALSLLTDSEPKTSQEDCTNDLGKNLTIEVLYSIDALKRPTTL